MPELDRAIYGLVKGYEIQKKSIIKNLRRYMLEPNSNTKLVPIIITSVDGWDMKFQIEGGNALKEGAIDKLLAERHCDTLTKMAGDCIQTNIATGVEDELLDEDSVSIKYVQAWESLFVEMTNSISLDGLKTEVVPFIKSLVGLKQKVAVRRHGVNILVKAGLKHDEQIILEYFKGLLLFGGHDLSWNIRLAIGEGMPKVARLLSQDNFLDIFYGDLIEFLNDIEILVRLSAIETVLEIHDMLSADQIKNDFAPVVKQHLNLEIDDAGNSRMSKLIGKIAFTLVSELKFSDATDEFGSIILDYFKDLADLDSSDLVANVCFNLPGMYFIFDKGELDIVKILDKYVKQGSHVRVHVAQWFHEVMSINVMNGGDAQEFKEMFFTLLGDNDTEVKRGMLGHLDEGVSYLMSGMVPNVQEVAKTEEEEENESDNARAEYVKEIVDYLYTFGQSIGVRNPFTAKPKSNKHNDHYNHTDGLWRLRLEFYEKLGGMFEVLPQNALKQAFFEAARFDFLNGAEPLRKQCAILLARIIFHEPYIEDKEEMLTSLTEELEHGTYIQRRGLLEFYEHSIEVFSKRYWYKNCYKGFMNYAQDKLPVLRIKFGRATQTIWKRVTKRDTEFDFMESANILIEDLDEDVQEAGLQIIKLDNSNNKEQEIEEEEKKRISIESKVVPKPPKEEKTKNESKAHSVSLRLKNNKMRARKRGSFTIGSRSKTSKVGKKKSISSAHSEGKVG